MKSSFDALAALQGLMDAGVMGLNVPRIDSCNHILIVSCGVNFK